MKPPPLKIRTWVLKCSRGHTISIDRAAGPDAPEGVTCAACLSDFCELQPMTEDGRPPQKKGDTK